MLNRGIFVKALVGITGSFILVGLAGAGTATAQAPTPAYSCSASALRVSLLGTTPIEPVIANGEDTPCLDANEGLPFVAVPNPILPLVSLSAVFARTDVLCASDDPDPTTPPVPGEPETENDQCDAGPTVNQQVVSRGGAADVTINLGGLVIRARALESNARAFCDPVTNRPAFESDSRVVELTVNGMVIEIPQDGEPFVLDLGLVRLALNDRVGTEGVQPADQTSGSLTRRALRVSLPSDGSITDIVVGESKVDYSDDVCPEGKVVIKKETSPDEDPNATEFGFTTTGGLTPATFTLQDDGERTFTDVRGKFTVTEDAPTGPYSLETVNCVDPTGNTVSSVADRRAEIDVERGETVTCTFTNRRSPNGTVIVRKQTTPDEDPNATDFGFSTTGGLTPATFSLKDDGERVFTDVVPGTYSVTENAPSAPYSLASVECVDATGNTTTSVPNRNADIDVAAGETVVCTFTNARALKGTIVVKKRTTPAENPNATNFGFTSTGGLTPPTFTLQDDGERTFTDLTPGEYSVTENAPAAPFTLTLIDCTDPTDNTTTSVPERKASMNVAAGETVTCTFVNFRPGPGTVTCPSGTAPDANGQCVAQNTQCPPGTSKNPQGQCVANTATCPPGTARNPQGQCITTSVQCPPGTSLLPGLLRCEAVPTGGRIVPRNQLPVGPCRDVSYGAQFGVLGTNGPDRITGSNLNDRIFSFGGNDRVSGGRGRDCVQGGSGRDTLDGSNDSDYLLGESGDDRLSGGPGNDRLSGGSGNDRMSGSNGNDRLDGGAGRDKLRGEDGNDRLVSGAGNDTLHTGNGRDRVFAGSGNDIINAATRGPAAFVDCGPGIDRVRINNNERRRIRNCEFVDTFKRIRRLR